MTDPRAKGWAASAIVLLAALAVGAGLVLTGGPLQGRKEARDRLRLEDLEDIWRQMECRADYAGQALDGDIAATEGCPDAPRLIDPFTNALYRIEVIDAQNVRLCAGFETDLLIEGLGYRSADRQADGRDCMVMHRKDTRPPGASLVPPDGGLIGRN